MKFKISLFSLQALLLLVLVCASTGCSVKGNISDESQISLEEQYSQNTGLVSGSSQNEVVSGYRVSGTIGDSMGGIQEVVNGYTVIQSIQGNINSATFRTTNQ